VCVCEYIYTGKSRYVHMYACDAHIVFTRRTRKDRLMRNRIRWEEGGSTDASETDASETDASDSR